MLNKYTGILVYTYIVSAVEENAQHLLKYMGPLLARSTILLPWNDRPRSFSRRSSEYYFAI